MDAGKIFLARQVHGNNVLVIDEKIRDYEVFKKKVSLEACDALITDQVGVPLTVLTADCVPLILLDPVRRVLGVIHAGWRGTLRRVTEITLKTMAATFHVRPADCLAVIGPSVRGCCYEVDDAVIEPFRGTFNYWERLATRKGPHKWYLDLARANYWQLMTSKVREENIAILNFCTYCNRELFFSYRRDGKKTGRMLSTAMLREGSR